MGELERRVQRTPGEVGQGGAKEVMEHEPQSDEIAQRIPERCKTAGSRSMFALRRGLVTTGAHHAYGLYALCSPLVHHVPQALRSNQCFALESMLCLAAYT